MTRETRPHDLSLPPLLPPLGDNPSTQRQGTSPGSFANKGRVGTPWTFSSPDTPGMPQPSGRTAWDFMPADWTCLVPASAPASAPAPAPAPAAGSVASAELAARRARASAWRAPTGFVPRTQLEHARLGTVTPQMVRVAEREGHLTPEQVRDEVAAGRMVIPANVNHLRWNLDPMAIGRASRTKVNANMGASPVSSGTEEEVEKLRWAERWGADTVMDLSTGGDLDACRAAIVRASTVPIGTVPIYSMILGRRIEDLDEETVLASLRHQAEQGVDYFTIHAGVRRAHLDLVRRRLIGIVSRGGALLAKWMLHHGRENLMFTAWERICDVMREHDVTFSIGDGLRPGGTADATDAAQLAELATLGELTERAWRKGVQVMVEGPGHVPFDQIEFNMKLQRRLCHGAPFYVLGPLVTDIFPGYDHITSCIGATAAGYHGAAMLCYVTPKEHLALPKKDDVKQGCVAYRIAAHAADVALGIPGARDRDDELTKARAALNWERHFELSFDPELARAYHDEDLKVDTDFCAMCGHDWCSVRISKEIAEFGSGKDRDAQPERRTQASPALVEARADAAGRAALEARAREAAAEHHKLGCHSEVADDDTARRVQEELVRK
jgi:phosphomethylpyrimidine synthase